MFKIATKPAIIFAFLCLFSMPKRLVFGVSDGDLRRTAPTWRGSASAMEDGHVEYDDDYEDNILLNESDALNDWSDDDSNGSSGEIWQNDDDNDDDDDNVGQSTTDESEEEIISENKISHPKGVIIEPIDAKIK
ncbi:hypothetical protein GPALN_005185 [Globodera pallida]|nr:hypothetical protein GPALN_005185 [Globodera pallida]